MSKHFQTRPILFSVLLVFSFSLILNVPQDMGQVAERNTWLPDVIKTKTRDLNKVNLPKIAPNLAEASGKVQSLISFEKNVPADLPFEVLYRYLTRPVVYVQGVAWQLR